MESPDANDYLKKKSPQNDHFWQRYATFKTDTGKLRICHNLKLVSPCFLVNKIRKGEACIPK